MDSADTKPSDVQENLSQDDNDPGTLVVDILSDSGEDSARCMSDVDNGTMSAEDVQDASSKNVKDPESVMVGEHSNVPSKEEQELGTVVVDMHVETPSKPEQNTETLVGETHIDELIKPEQDSLTVAEDTHIEELSEIEVELETLVKNIQNDIHAQPENKLDAIVKDTHTDVLPKSKQNLKIIVEETHIDALVKPENKLEMVVAEIFSDIPDKNKESLDTVVTETHSNDPNTKEENMEANVAETHSDEPGRLADIETDATEKLIDTADKCKENMETVVEEAYIDAPGKNTRNIETVVEEPGKNIENMEPIEAETNIDSPGKNEENIKTVVEEMHIDAPGRSEQSIETIVNETHEDAPVKNEENIETNVEERDTDVFNKQEQNSDASINSISISDLNITQEELVTINIFDSLQIDTLNEKKKCSSSDGSPSSVNVPFLRTAIGNKVKKNLTSKTQDISVADDHKHIASDLKNVALMSNKPRLKKNLVSSPSNGLPIVSSKLPNTGQDSALSNTKVNIKKRGSLVVKTIGPRTIRNVSVDYSLNKGGVYVDPSGTILITREMDSGRTSDSPKEKAFPTLQNGNTHLSCSTSPHVKPKVKAKHSRKKLDNEPATSKGSLIKKTLVDSTGSDEVLITTQINDKLAVVHDTAPCKKYVSAKNSLTENGVYVDPSGSVLITREMDDGKACDSSRVRVFPTKNGKKVLSRKRRKTNDEQNLKDLDNKPSTSQRNLSKKSRNSTGNGEVLSVKQHDELAAVDNGAAPIIYNTNTRYSLRKSGKYFDPSGTKLISRDRRNGNACNSSKVRAFSPPQNTKKHLPCSKVSQASIKVHNKQNLTNLDNEHSSSQGSFTDNEEDLISNEPDLNDVDSSTAAKKKMSKRGIKTVGEINNAYCKTQDGNRHNCCFCSRVLKKDEENTCLALNKPLPSSLLDITSLLKCLGISSPLPPSGNTKRNSSIVLCQYCYSLVSEGDIVYKKLLSVTSNMKQLWSDNDGENVTAPFSDRSLKKEEMLQVFGNKQLLHSSRNTQGKCRPILTFPNMVKESHSISSNVDGKMPKLILKQQCSNSKMRVCEFCGMDLNGRDWNLHQAAVHRVERKWRWYYLQPILKTLLAKEIHGVNIRQGEDSANGKYEKTNTRKCTACSKTFSLRDEFVDHLQHYHNMVIDEEFLSYIIDEDFWSYISDDAGFMDWSNNGDRENIENPIEIKSEVMSDDQDGGKSSASEVAHSNNIQDNDTINCKDAGKQDILHNGKGGKPHRNSESSALLVSDDCHNYIGTNGNKVTIMPRKDNFKKESRTDLCCRICTKSFIRQVDLEKHEQLHHPESVNESKTMGVKEGHLKTSHGVNHLLPINSTKTKVSCKLCDKICGNAEDLNNHRDTCHGNTVAALDHYGGDNDNVVEMSETINLDVDNVNKESKFQRPQTNALKQKHKIQSFKCNMCGDTFENRIMLVKHKRSCHAFEENCLEIMECDICGRKLHGIQYLHLHMSQVHNKPHNPPLQHQCNMCIYHCRTLNQLEEHMQEKHGVNMLPPVKCEEHGEMHSDKDNDIHTICENQKKMSCNFCAMQFKTKSSLEHHISEEHENKKWQCDKCHTGFEKYHLLKQHNMYIHSAKNYQCSQCEKSFKRKSDMISHGKNVHKKKILSECTYCLKDFPDHKSLRTHIIRKHSTSWEVTSSKNYARHQQENSCMHKQQPRCSNTSPNSTLEETEKMEVKENKHDLEHTGEHAHYEKEQKENLSEQYQDSGPHEISQEQLTPVEETVVTEYEEVGVEALENPQEYNMVDNGTMSAEDVQETSSKHVKDPESVMVVKHYNGLDKEEQELETIVVDMNDDAPSKPEQNITFVDKAHFDVLSVKPKHNLETVMEESHIDELGELEQTSGLSITNICIGDLSNSQEDLVTISINDCHPNDTLNDGQNCVSSDGNLSCVNVSSLETTFATKVKKDFTAETRSIIVDDSQKCVASDLRKVSISIKHSSKNILPVPLPSSGHQIVTSKVQNVGPDNVYNNSTIKNKILDSVVRTIAPRTIRNKSANYSPRLSGTYVDPSGTILINREMENGKVSSSSKAIDFSTLQNATKVLPCSTYSQIKVRVNKKLKNVDNEFSIGRQNYTESTVHCSGNDEALISRQLDELTGIDNIAAENNRPVNEITKTSNDKTVSEINDVNCETQDGSNHSCCFCRRILKRSKGNTWLSLNKPLPLSLLDPISLLQCLGISSPLLATGKTNDNLISVCRQCYALLSDGDAVYQRLLSVISQMKQLWPDDDSELLTVAVSSNGSDTALKKKQILQILKNKQPLQSSHTTQRKCRFILPKPDMVKESHSVTNNIDGNMAKVRLKKEHSYNKMRICGFCGMDLYGEEEWNLHQAAVHRVDQKWRWFNLQPTLKTLLAKKIQQFNMKQNEDSRQNFQYEMTNAHKCAACSSTFSLHDEFVVHLRHYHNMVVDEDFLSSILEDANLISRSNISEREHMENPIQIKSEVIWHDQDGKSSASDMVHSNSIQDNDAITCEEMGMQSIIDCGKEEQSQISTENQSLPVPDDFHNYIGTKDTVKLEKENSEKDCRVELCCSICEKSFIRQTDLEKHEQLQHSKSVKMSETKVIKENKLVPSPGINSLPRTLRAKTKVTCKLCNQICCNSEALNCHVDTCHENSVVILNKDGYGGVIDNRLDMSKALGSDLDDVQNESEVPKFQANASRKKIDKTQSFVCRVCGNTFVNRLLLVRHKRSSHGDVCGVGEGNGLVMVECNLCGRRLNGIRSLHLHMSKVHKKSPKYPLKHRCKICIYHSRTRNQLEKHMQEKHGLNVLPPVECKECGKMYSAKYIDIHIANMHENQKRFSCNFCAMKFNIKSSLKCHISYEHANNKWPCDKCHIEFEKYHQLRQHRIYVHSTKIYTCQQCGKTFKRKSDMTEHEKRRHMEKIMSECTYCTKAYADRKKLRTHLIKKHGVAWEDTLSKSYARHQQENNCLRKRQHRSSSTSQNLPHNEETEGTGIQQNKYDLEHTGQHVLYEEEQKGLFEERYQDGDSCQIYQDQHCAQVEERTITAYEGASVETLENEQEYNMVQVTEGSENITNMANICYIVLEETQP